MQNLLGASWKTTVIGFLAAMLNYFDTLGTNLPVTGEDWGHAAMSAVLFAFGVMTKDANVTNSSHPTTASVASDVVIATQNPTAAK